MGNRQRMAQLSARAREDPAAVVDCLPELRQELATLDPRPREHAAEVVATIAHHYPEAARTAVDDIRPLLSDANPGVRAEAARALAEVATTFPDAVYPSVCDLLDRLTDDHYESRVNAAWALAELATEQPAGLRPAVEALCGVLTDDVAAVRAGGVWALAELAEEYPEPVRNAVPALRRLLDDDATLVRVHAARALAVLAETHPDAVEPARVDLEAFGNGEPEDLRKAVTFALAQLDEQTTEAKATSTAGATIDDPLPEEEWIFGGSDTETTATSSGLSAGGIPETVPDVPTPDLSYDDLKKQTTVENGDLSAVYRAAASTENGTVPVALKELRPSDGATLDSDLAHEAYTEARRWEGLDDHDHIVTLVDYGREPTVWFAMEYMDAGHLAEVADSLAFEHRLWSALVLTRAIRRAHRAGILHLNLKPENVLFRTVDDGWAVPKISDWGMEIQPHQDDHDVVPRYAAPEQLADDGRTDGVTDVYQLGRAFYQLFTGRPAFETTPECPADIVEAEPPAPSDIASVPAAVGDIIRTAMAPSQPDRYGAVVYLQEELETICADHGVPTT